jgi:hypothetical protein
MHQTLPQEVKACLWSYDTDLIDFSDSDHRQRVIHNVLDHGTAAATKWLMETFERQEIAEAIAATSRSAWNKKSIALWSLVFSVEPGRTSRFS